MSCTQFEYHPYAKGFSGETDIHSRTLHEIESACVASDTVRFAFITDTQASYNELEDAIEYINSRKDIMFVIHGGDQTDFGLVKEFEWCRDRMADLHVPYCILLGNHDCLGTGEHTYISLYGNSNFSFNSGFVHFVCLNTNALEYDYSHPVPDLTYLRNDRLSVEGINAAVKDSLSVTVAVMHAPPFDEQFNDNVAYVFQDYIKEYPGLAFGLHGHTHNTTVRDIFKDGIIYYGCANMADKVLLVFTITRNGYECETVCL